MHKQLFAAQQRDICDRPAKVKVANVADCLLDCLTA